MIFAETNFWQRAECNGEKDKILHCKVILQSSKKIASKIICCLAKLNGIALCAAKGIFGGKGYASIGYPFICMDRRPNAGRAGDGPQQNG
ncbi:hypothetical protein LZK80_03505 [Rhizobium leguminosarum]|nr:hypothetical protein LZK80_03505 [Rhizobium leguminosarum]